MSFASLKQLRFNIQDLSLLMHIGYHLLESQPLLYLIS